MAGNSEDLTSVLVPDNLPFPITITKLKANVGAKLKRGDHLFDYSYVQKISVAGGGRTKDEKRYNTWESPFDGELKRWSVKRNVVIKGANVEVAKIQEPCKHEVVVWGMCSACGQTVTQNDYNGSIIPPRVGIGLAHDGEGITVSLEEAKRLNDEIVQRLLGAKKLVLIVDLDQTIVHATVDPTVCEWIAEGEAYEAKKSAKEENEKEGTPDEVNPNWEALKDVKKFKLNGDEVPQSGGRPRDRGPRSVSANEPGCFYYIKPRPGLNSFLADLKSKYEMHVYTMGTRAYATEVCAAIDPKGDIFSERILSRDDSGNLHAKTLERLFPCDTSMVVVIDDRSDVWGHIPNVVKVIPYNFFGIGDINAAGLPKQPDSMLTPAPTAPPNASKSDTFPASRTAFTSKTEADGASSEAEKAAQAIAEAKTKVIEALVEERPLAKMQEKLDSADESKEASSSRLAPSSSGSNGEVKHKHKALLRNDDTELDRVQKILDNVHQLYYSALDPKTARFINGVEPVTDVKAIITNMKARIFSGMHILFSSVIPMDQDPLRNEIWRTAEIFGAVCHTSLDDEVTHVVAAKPGTDKVNAARKRKSVKILWISWFLDCVSEWKRLPPTGKYRMTFEEDDAYVTAENPSSDGADPNGHAPADDEEEEAEEDEAHPNQVTHDMEFWEDIDKEVDDFLNESEDDEDEDDSDTGSMHLDSYALSALGKRRRGSPASSSAAESDDEGPGPSSYPNTKRRTEDDEIPIPSSDLPSSDHDVASGVEESEQEETSGEGEEDGSDDSSESDEEDFLAKEFG